MTARKEVEIEVDGVMYDSITKAAEVLGCKPYNITDAFRSGKNNWKGHILKRFDGKYKNSKRIHVRYSNNIKNRRGGCKIVCLTTGKTFSSIKSLADVCDGATSWTIGLNLAKYGKYVDRKGNVYIKQSDVDNAPSISNIVKKRINEKINNKSVTHIDIVKAISTNKSNSNLSESDEKALGIVTSNLVQAGKYNEASILLNILRNKA